jgi:3-oxoadipate enol-lactonase
MPVVQANGIDMHYRADGAVMQNRADGAGDRAVLFIHALGADLDIWGGVVAQLPAGMRYLRYDLRGHGRSALAPGPYSLALLAADLLALMDALNIARATLCGVSIGGLIAQAAALAAPGRVDGLILCDTASRIGSRDGWQARIDAVTARGLADMAGEITARWYAPGFCAAEPALCDERRERLAGMAPAGYVAACHALRDGDLTPDRARLTAPALVICGEDDVAAPPAQSRDLAASLPGARLEIMSGVGHLPPVEAPARLAGLIESFLTEAKVA